MCIAARGFCGNLGDPVISTDDLAVHRVAAHNKHPGPARARRPWRGSKVIDATVVPPSEGKRSAAGRMTGSLSV
jgi:hypothetical protein